MQLKVTERQQGEVAILELEGRVILGKESEAVYNHVKKALKAGRKKIILQLQKVDRIDSVGIGSIISSMKSARSAGGKLVLLQPSKQVNDVLDLLGLRIRPDVFPVFADEQEALNNF